MEAIREQLVYKDGKVHICMKELKPVEQYEVIRLLIATRTKDVLICTHESVNEYILKLIQKLQLNITPCEVSTIAKTIM
jgi:hypothetical protein